MLIIHHTLHNNRKKVLIVQHTLKIARKTRFCRTHASVAVCKFFLADRYFYIFQEYLPILRHIHRKTVDRGMK